MREENWQFVWKVTGVSFATVEKAAGNVVLEMRKVR